jgi:hypothetical protein
LQLFYTSFLDTIHFQIIQYSSKELHRVQTITFQVNEMERSLSVTLYANKLYLKSSSHTLDQMRGIFGVKFKRQKYNCERLALISF